MAYEYLHHFKTRDEAALFELLPTPVWLFDVRHYGFWWCNEAALKMWNVESVQDMIDKDLSGDSDGAKRRVWQTFEIAAAQGERGETWTTYPNNKPKVTYMRHRSVLLGEERVEGIVAFVNDEVDLGSMPENILLIEAMRYISNPITVYSMDGHLMRQNEAAGDVYGSQREADVADADPLFVRRFQDRAAGHARLERARNKVASREEFEVETKSGTRRHILDVRVSRDPLSGDFNLVVTEEDVTDLRAAVERAEEANKAKSEFLAVMSHELRTPLNGILGFTDTLLDEGLSDEHQEMLRHIRESGIGLLDLLNDILDLSKVEAGAMELDPHAFDPARLADRVAAFWRPTVQAKGVDFDLRRAPDPMPVLKGDSLRLRQVLNNLLSNALKFTDVGTVSLDVTCAPAASGRYRLDFEVRDTGVGIAEADQSKLFAKFSQADGSVSRKYGGSGLGLSICRTLVDLMGGEISLESTPGKGTTIRFHVELEAGDPKAVHEESWDSRSDPVQEAMPTRCLNILIAEDNHTNQRLLKAYLGNQNAVLTFVDDGAAAVEKVTAEAYDLILMDSRMPGMDGVAATAEIRKMSGDVAKTPIIVLTADAMIGDRERYLKAGMDDYIAKPIERSQLLSAIARAARGEE